MSQKCRDNNVIWRINWNSFCLCYSFENYSYRSDVLYDEYATFFEKRFFYTLRIHYFNLFDESNLIRSNKNGLIWSNQFCMMSKCCVLCVIWFLILAWENNLCFYSKFNVISTEKRVKLFQNRPWYPDNFVYNSIRTSKWYVLYQ